MLLLGKRSTRSGNEPSASGVVLRLSRDALEGESQPLQEIYPGRGHHVDHGLRLVPGGELICDPELPRSEVRTTRPSRASGARHSRRLTLLRRAIAAHAPRYHPPQGSLASSKLGHGVHRILAFLKGAIDSVLVVESKEAQR